ncbi:MAG: hypothetical protein AUJ85_02310 [Elusimicrobia bacterium CG1_02_37_114]|nr:MAG: hypothetical protein AUJ85_02310 [Elusimicrobia bacterium CG1_02_37_114]PIV53351.1 MAG: hypothetical protein COS17_04330 [Elusimicrobia bacterium CG02_land_8_20_14_3_00_37_13]PIZ12954.1 MAG: hypothetical protein COY53_07360 [Elusimicrobia bacterium CG_4_10_14_0_8_um_filter_37_32]
MNYSKIRKLKDKLYFSIENIENYLNVKKSSARMFCSRYVKNGLFIRLKNNFYTLRENWEKITQEELFLITNSIQVPSYISFMSALCYYDISTQVQRNYIESAVLKRSKTYEIENTVFNYYKLKNNLYFGFQKLNGFFIATKEKAFFDSVYLYSLGRYKFDVSSLDLDKLDRKKIKNMLKYFPEKTKNIVVKLCRI